MSEVQAGAAASALRWRATQQVAVKLIFLVRTPVLARLLAPDDFGLLAIGLVSLDIMLRLTEVGMVPALVQRGTLERRHYDVAWTVGLLRGGAVAIAVFLAAPVIAATFGDERATPIVQALGLRPLLLALASIGVADLTRRLRFKPLAVLDLSDMTVDAVVSIALAPFIGVWALVAGALSGPVVRFLLSYVLAPHAPRPTLDRDAAASLVRFGRWIFITGVIGLAGRFVLQAAIARQLGTAELGLYYLAAKIATTTTEISEGLVGVVAFPWFARLQGDRSEARRTFRRVVEGIAIVLIPIGFMIAALAGSIVADVLGPAWTGAAPVIQVMVAASLIGAFGDAVLPLLNGMGQPHKVTLLAFVQNALLAALVWSAAGAFGLVGAAGAWIPATLVAQLLAYGMLRTVFVAPLAGVVELVAVVAAASLAGGGLAWAVDGVIGGLLGLLLGSAAGGATITLLLLVADRLWPLGLVDALRSLSPRLGRMASRMSDALFAARA